MDNNFEVAGKLCAVVKKKARKGRQRIRRSNYGQVDGGAGAKGGQVIKLEVDKIVRKAN